MPAPERHFSPAEVSRLFGVSPKALRLYETRGFLKVARTENGWRVFGRAELARLHKILALKALRLPLGRIAELLDGQGVSLDRILAAHEQALLGETAQAARALGLVRAARAKLAHGQKLSVDDIAHLAKETSMPLKSGHKELGRLLESHVQAHFSPAEIEEAARRDFDQERIGRDWDALIGELKALMARNDTTSPAAVSLGRRWMAQVDQFTRGDAQVAAKVQAVWTEAMADPQAAAQLPLSPEMFAFIGEIQSRAEPV